MAKNAKGNIGKQYSGDGSIGRSSDADEERSAKGREFYQSSGVENVASRSAALR